MANGSVIVLLSCGCHSTNVKAWHERRPGLWCKTHSVVSQLVRLEGRDEGYWVRCVDTLTGTRACKFARHCGQDRGKALGFARRHSSVKLHITTVFKDGEQVEAYEAGTRNRARVGTMGVNLATPNVSTDIGPPPF